MQGGHGARPRDPFQPISLLRQASVAGVFSRRAAPTFGSHDIHCPFRGGSAADDATHASPFVRVRADLSETTCDSLSFRMASRSSEKSQKRFTVCWFLIAPNGGEFIGMHFASK
mmetsp:Transcript_53695/g.110862  ORF Transcript_53695/g.110862 Transcript_53695/m.110862 type:complete len:114 (-) Transcript_53695:4-345(-)